MATMVALPTDEEIEEAGAADAGDFLIAMQAHSPTEYAQFVASRKPTHSDPDGSDFHQHSTQVPHSTACGTAERHTLTASFPSPSAGMALRGASNNDHRPNDRGQCIDSRSGRRFRRCCSGGRDGSFPQATQGLALTLKSDLNRRDGLE